MSIEHDQDFRRAIDCPEDRIDLGLAALTLARLDYPGLDVGAYLSRIDRLGDSVGRRLGNGGDVYRVIATINYVLFDEQGFRGNRESYYDPKNSFLNEVIERKVGIPITLSVLYMEVARRIGLELEGVGFPGHFLVQYSAPNEELVIDPFNAGEIQSRQSLEKMLDALSGGKLAFDPSFLAPVTKRQILKRMLNNLKLIYLPENDLAKTLSVMEHLLTLDPGSAEDLRDRGVIYLKLECFRQALADLEGYLRLAPDAEDATVFKDRVVRLKKQVAEIH